MLAIEYMRLQIEEEGARAETKKEEGARILIVTTCPQQKKSSGALAATLSNYSL